MSALRTVLKKVWGPYTYFYPGMRRASKLSLGFIKEQALDRAMEYARVSQLKGDYLEFGVYQGRAFCAACYAARRRGLPMRFFAFDSFQGLPENEERDPAGRQWFQEGQLRCDEREFLKNVRRTGAEMKRVTSVPGWFEESLRPDNPLLTSLRKAAVVWIDCDLYSSTCTVLKFLTRYVQYGTLILFDDWFAFLADPNAGQQRAFHEWLEANPHLSAVELMRFGWCGNSFVIHDARDHQPQ